MADIPHFELLKAWPEIKVIGILGQEAHASDVWPIGDEEALCASYDLASRERNLQILLERFPSLSVFDWYLDPPNQSFYHVGGSFNSVFGTWPHRYLVFDREGGLLFHPPFHRREKDQYVLFSDLLNFLTKGDGLGSNLSDSQP